MSLSADDAQASESASLLTALIDLPASQRVVVLLRDVYGWRAAQVTREIGISEPRQRLLLHQGRVALRSFLHPEP